MSPRKKPSLPQAPTLSPGWITKTAPDGRAYRACTISLDLLPLLYEVEGLEPGGFTDHPLEGGFALWVRKRKEEGSQTETAPPLPHSTPSLYKP